MSNKKNKLFLPTGELWIDDKGQCFLPNHPEHGLSTRCMDVGAITDFLLKFDVSITGQKIDRPEIAFSFPVVLTWKSNP